MSDPFDDEDELVATKAWDSAVLKRLAGFVRPHLRIFLISFSVLLGVFALELLSPWILPSAIDGPIREAQAARDAETTVDLSPYVRELGWWAAAYLGVVLASGLFRYLQLSLLTKTGQSVIHDLRIHLFRHIHRLELAWFDRRPTGSLVTRVTSDIEDLTELFTSGLVFALGAPAGPARGVKVRALAFPVLPQANT